MKKRKLLIIILNIIGICCLIYCAVPYIKHDTSVANPDSMLSMEGWDGAGMLMTLGLIPMVIANSLCFFEVFRDTRKRAIRSAAYLPSIIEACFVIHYWIYSLLFYN